MTAMGRTRVAVVDPLKMNAHAVKGIHTTPTQALMEAAPFEDPPESALEKMLRHESVKAAIESLPDNERYVIEAKFWRGRGTRIVAREMGVSHQTIHRWFRSGMARLEEVLREEFG